MNGKTVVVGLAMLALGIVIGYGIAVYPLISDARKSLDAFVADSEIDLRIKVLAKQYSWHFHYAGDDGKFGIGDVDQGDADNPFGLNFKDPFADDDYWSEVLMIPISQRVEVLDVASTDVIHSLGGLREGRSTDAVPGTSSRPFSFRTPEEPGEGLIRCMQLCGPGHDQHFTAVRYVSEDEFREWIVTRRAALAR